MSMQVRKGNKILRISEDAKDRYLKMGYNIIDETGNVITEAVPVDVNQLKLGYARMSEEIEKLKNEIKTLKVSNDYLTQENDRLTKELTTLKSAPITERTTRRRKQSTEETSEVAE